MQVEHIETFLHLISPESPAYNPVSSICFPMILLVGILRPHRN